MGTSSPFGGAGGNTPLIPSWLQPGEGADDGGGQGPTPAPPSQPNQPPSKPQNGTKPEPNRFQTARGNYTRFASSGGTDRKSLGRALSSYVSQGVGGASSASIRMGTSKSVATSTARFFADVQREGVRDALFQRGIEYKGQEVGTALLEILNKMPFDGGPIDEAIARDAMVESIIDNFEDLSVGFEEVDPAVYSALLEDFVTRSIVARTVIDIGIKGISVAKDAEAAQYIQKQLEDVIRGAVSDAFSKNGGIDKVTYTEYKTTIDQIYTDAYTFINILGDSL